jgi:hypothetical protein
MYLQENAPNVIARIASSSKRNPRKMFAARTWLDQMGPTHVEPNRTMIHHIPTKAVHSYFRIDSLSTVVTIDQQMKQLSPRLTYDDPHAR